MKKIKQAARGKKPAEKEKPRVKRKYSRDQTYTCYFCAKTSVGKRDRRRHMFAAHRAELLKELGGSRKKNRMGIDKAWTGDNQRVKCPACPRTMNRKSLKKHREKHCQAKPRRGRK